MSTTAAAVARALANAGIERVFGLPGGEVLVLIDELRRAGVDFVLMRHEANAGIAAAVYGKLRGQPGVVLATLGPGAANLMLPLASAHLDQEPLLAISAQLPDEFPPSHTHQLLPLHDAYRPICRLAGKITSENAGDLVPQALAACMERPHGAAYLTLSAREAVKPFTSGDNPILSADLSAEAQGAKVDARTHAADLRRLLQKAERPLVLIGLGLNTANASRLRQWLNDWNLPVAVTPKVKGIVDETAANFVGVISGMAADGLMVDALKSSDLLIGFGLDPVEVDKLWHAELPIHWVLEAPNVGGIVPAGVELVDHAEILEVLTSYPPPRRWAEPFAETQKKRRDLLTASPGAAPRRGGSSTFAHSASADRLDPPSTMWPGEIITSLADAVPSSTIVTTDVGSHKYLFGQFWPSRHPGTFWMSNGLSGMAYGLSAAIGAKLACPDVPVLCAVGDGGFSMNAQELETAERVGAPFVTVVLEDGSYSLIKLAQEGRKLEPYRMDFRPIDTVKMAEACGVAALRTANPDELATAVRSAVESGRSLVVAVPVNYEDYRLLF
ncbi:MAG: thiamine pyrophosphate-binding protein [Acidobacteriota bacterium]|nr:thiamine pyrophosphate-binding protein [Acidobacteriota bacterium]